MYICLCADQTEDQVNELIANGITDIETIMEETGVGTGCGTCQLWLENMVATKVSERAQR